MVDHDKILGLRLFIGSKDLLAFNAQQFNGHPVGIGVAIIELLAIRKAYQSMIRTWPRKNTMPQVCREMWLDDKISANTAMLLRMLATRNRCKLAIDMFLNFAMDRDDLIYLIRLARWNEFLAHCNVNRFLFHRC